MMVGIGNGADTNHLLPTSYEIGNATYSER